MTNKVNPPPQFRWPKKWQSDPEIRSALKQLDWVLWQLWLKLGGSSDPLSDLDNVQGGAAVTDLAEIENLKQLIESQRLREDKPSFYSVTKNSNYEAVAYDYINCKMNCTITLPEYPNANDAIIIRNGDGSLIKINGNGNNINGESSAQLRRQGTSLYLQYFIDTNEWFAR